MFYLDLTELVQRRTFLCITGTSGAGKTASLDALIDLAKPTVARPSSFTTRPRRDGENSKEYVFISDSEMFSLLASGRIAYIDQAYGNFYAMDKHSIEELFISGHLPSKEILDANIDKLSVIGVRPIIIEVTTTQDTASHGYRADRTEHCLPKGSNKHLTYRVDRTHKRPTDIACEMARWLTTVSAFMEILDGDLSTLIEAERLNIQGYEAVGREFDEHKRVTTKYFHDISKSFWHSAISELQSGDRVLEIGPGNSWLRQTHRWPGDVEYIGLELVQSILCANVDRDRIRLGTACQMPFPDNLFDHVFGSLIDPLLSPNALCEVHRTLRPGGFFVGTTPAGEWAQLSRPIEGLRRTAFTLGDGSEATVSSFCFSLKGIERLLRAAGFTEFKVCPLPISQREVGADLPPAVAAAFSRWEKDALDLPIVNSWIARKPWKG